MSLPAYDGKEALECLEKDSNIEVVILDIKMPVMDGMTALKEIKSKHPLGGGDHAHRSRHGGDRDRRHENGRL